MNLRGRISFIIGLAGFIACFLIGSGDIKSTVFKISLGFVLSGTIDFMVFLAENKKHWGLLKTQFLKRNQPVRVTIAYLFRIEVNGKYVLIKRHKKDRAGYQPVGGTFKYFKEENRELFDELGVEPCDHVPRDEKTDHDLRIRLKERKKLVDFIKWFESRKNRELDPWREFYEELVEPGLLQDNIFRHVKYVFICKHIEGVLKSPVFPVDEFRCAEVYELRPETDAQRKAIGDLINFSEEIIFASPDEIRKGATNDGRTILPHTFKILPK